jgi:hypothetical protein
MGWATFWVIFSQTHLVSLAVAEKFSPIAAIRQGGNLPVADETEQNARFFGPVIF